MTTSESPTARPHDRSFVQWLREMPRWKKVALAAAIVTAAVGAVMTVTAQGNAPVGGSGNLSGLSSGLVNGQNPQGGAAAGPVEEPAAKGVFRLGFSFIAGFCIGSFIRSTLKIAAIAFGFWLFLTMVLSYYGILNVDWNAMDSLWSRFTANVEQEWGSFQSFMTGSLPAAGLAVTGLAIGLKRH